MQHIQKNASHSVIPPKNYKIQLKYNASSFQNQ